MIQIHRLDSFHRMISHRIAEFGNSIILFFIFFFRQLTAERPALVNLPVLFRERDRTMASTSWSRFASIMRRLFRWHYVAVFPKKKKKYQMQEFEMRYALMQQYSQSAIRKITEILRISSRKNWMKIYHSYFGESWVYVLLFGRRYSCSHWHPPRRQVTFRAKLIAARRAAETPFWNGSNTPIETMKMMALRNIGQHWHPSDCVHSKRSRCSCRRPPNSSTH